ncbi:hypothetical protein [Sphingomonas sp.]|uniref:hypothetical protein n=1 Tax=Sphingomonas sp. TaxID=28214 RepID=UPI00257EF179|nr:hypothetical protein [Sphingomonas sp.]
MPTVSAVLPVAPGATIAPTLPRWSCRPYSHLRCGMLCAAGHANGMALIAAAARRASASTSNLWIGVEKGPR